MRYDDPQLQDTLAGLYALGALRHAARARFETLLARDPRLRRRVTEWQERLAPLAEETPEIAPPARVLAALRRRLRPETGSRWWWRLEFWRPFGTAAATLAAVLGVYLGVQLARPPATVTLDPRYLAVLEDDGARPVVVVTGHANPFRLTVEPLSALAVPPDRVLRIWAVDRTSGVHRRLADFAPGPAQRIVLSEAEWQLVKGARSLVVSEEPRQSTSSGPTGRILYSGLCLNLKGPRDS